MVVNYYVIQHLKVTGMFGLPHECTLLILSGKVAHSRTRLYSLMDKMVRHYDHLNCS